MTSIRLPTRSPPAEPIVDRTIRLDSLTGLRFFAALAVFIHHFNGFSPGGGYARVPFLFPESRFGVNGVFFFFVLSGFVLTWSWRPRDGVLHFYWRRIARIYPLHIATSLIAFAALFWFGAKELGWFPGLSSLFLLQTWFPNMDPPLPGNGVSWTLSCEIFFYAIFPFALVFLRRLATRKLWFVAAGIALAMLAFATWSQRYLDAELSAWTLRHPLYTVGCFLLGIILALAISRGDWLPFRTWHAVAAMAVWIVVFYDLVPRLSSETRLWSEHLNEMVVPLLCAAVIAAVAQSELSGRRSFLRTRVLVLLGAWSYAFYLIHRIVMRFALEHGGGSLESNWNIFTLVGMMVVTVALSALLYYVVEHPIERRLRRIGARWFSRRGEAEVRPTAHDVEVIGKRTTPALPGAPQGR